MSNSKVCAKCGETKAISDFFIRPDSTIPTSECKVCMRARNKEKTSSSKLVTFVKGESFVIERLRAIGISALPGKALSFKHCDVIAWGCVGIEVKHSLIESGGVFTFNFTPSQIAHGIRGDLVVLLMDYRDHIEPYVFRASDPVFYINGKLKAGTTYMTKRGPAGRASVFTDEVLLRTHRAWHLVEEVRQQTIQRLLGGGSPLPEWIRFGA